MLLINTNTASILHQSCLLYDPGSEHTLGGQTPLRSPLMLNLKLALCHGSSSARVHGWTAPLEARTESEANWEKHITFMNDRTSLVNPCSHIPYNLTILDECNCQQSNCYDDSDWQWFGPHVTLVKVVFLRHVIWAPTKSQENFEVLWTSNRMI